MLRRLVLSALAMLVLGGCVPVHRYPAYRGRVLELGTDAPIERAGVIVSYRLERASIGGPVPYFVGYQWALTTKEGRFEIPAKTFFTGKPLARFYQRPEVTIYKRGYGSFPSGFNVAPDRQGTTEPRIGIKGMPGNTEVIFRMPKLKSREEAKFEDTPFVLDIPVKLPNGVSRSEFRELFGH